MLVALLPGVLSFVPSAAFVGKTLGDNQRRLVSLEASNQHGNNGEENNDNKKDASRRTAVARLLSSPLAAAATTTAMTTSIPAPSLAADASGPKQTNLSDKEILNIVVDQDLVSNQFLVNGKLTRSIYDESCTFQDEIDTYGLDQWMKGTAKLFDGDRSKVVLVPGSVQSSPDGKNGLLQFRFVEYLCFNIPVIKPIVYLSGTLFLTRSETTGLITSYREKWDQDIYKVLTSESKLFTSSLSKESLDKDLASFFEANANR